MKDGIFIKGNVLEMHSPKATAFDKASIAKDLEDFKFVLDDILHTTLLVDVWRRKGFEDLSKKLGKILRVYERRLGEWCQILVFSFFLYSTSHPTSVLLITGV